MGTGATQKSRISAPLPDGDNGAEMRTALTRQMRGYAICGMGGVILAALWAQYVLTAVRRMRICLISMRFRTCISEGQRFFVRGQM